ncbi:hypothetical protein FB45DRAFT_1104674 [Roridomyces roridus]|uniref:CCHC-type domain-containing protein n=1 Tax=Roridomyces roridus TaxID=1738132 RepID=A0AAD7BCX8_9AGAR|nr:hypothetical protein FB45DRAFT_1104674 [Roridomyces roridus]
MTNNGRSPLRSHTRTLAHDPSVPTLTQTPMPAVTTEMRASVINARPVSPDLSYSRVAAGTTRTSTRTSTPPDPSGFLPLAAMYNPIPPLAVMYNGNIPPHVAMYNDVPSPAMRNPNSSTNATLVPEPIHSPLLATPRLTSTVDWGLLSDPRPMSSLRPHVTASSHVLPVPRERVNDEIDSDTLLPSDSTSTVSRAVQNMSIEELVGIARRHQALAQEALAAASERGRTIPPDENLINFRPVSVNPGTPRNSVVSPAVPSGVGPSQQKHKGVDPRNWGAIDYAHNMTERELDAQRAAQENFNLIHRTGKTEQHSQPPRFFDPMTIDPEPRTRDPFLKPMTNVPVSGQTLDDKIDELQNQLDSLKRTRTMTAEVTPSLTKAQKAVKDSIDRYISTPAPKFRPDPSPAARIVPGSFFDRTLRNASRVDGSPPSSDPSDSSSSDSESSHGSGPGRSHPSRKHRRRSSSKRRRPKKTNKMILKPIPPREYDGRPDAVAFHRFVKEGSNWVEVGRVPADQRVFYLSYHLKGHALQFYNSKVENDENSWTLSDFFWGLFNFCFPVNFREKQRTRLTQCVQGTKSVLSHKAEWEHIYNTIGHEANQEKVVMFWRSLNADIRKEMFRDKLDPESSSWAEVAAGAESAEIIVNVGRDDDNGLGDAKTQSRPDDPSTEIDLNGKRRNGGRALSVSATDIEPSRSKLPDKSAGKHLSAKKRAEYLASGLCFNCGTHGHMSRNCPEINNVASSVSGKPPGLSAHGLRFTIDDDDDGIQDALLESTKVLETLDSGTD